MWLGRWLSSWLDDDESVGKGNLLELGEVVVVLQVSFEVGYSAVRVLVAANVGPLEIEKRD
jgi:hypothetical protein